MTPSQNYYVTLQIKVDADLDTIKRAYRKKIRIYHPDQFAAELSRVKQSGDLVAIQKLEQKLQRAKQMTQQINEAYAVLSDATDRIAYDRYLSNERQRQYKDEIRQQRMQHWDVGRRTVKSRPHSQNPNIRRNPNQDERVPWVLLVVMIAIISFASILFTNALNRMQTPFTRYVPQGYTSEGSVRAIDLQATSNAEQATFVARRTIVFEPSATPRSSSANETLGDRLMSYGIVQNAIDAYSEAIAVDSDNTLIYSKRASAYTVLYENGDADVIELALADYSEAINLDDSFADAYLERGMLYYDLWLMQEDFAEEARADLEQYLTLTPQVNSDEIQSILDELP